MCRTRYCRFLINITFCCTLYRYVYVEHRGVKRLYLHCNANNHAHERLHYRHHHHKIRSYYYTCAFGSVAVLCGTFLCILTLSKTQDAHKFQQQKSAYICSINAARRRDDKPLKMRMLAARNEIKTWRVREAERLWQQRYTRIYYIVHARHVAEYTSKRCTAQARR